LIFSSLTVVTMAAASAGGLVAATGAVSVPQAAISGMRQRGRA